MDLDYMAHYFCNMNTPNEIEALSQVDCSGIAKRLCRNLQINEEQVIYLLLKRFGEKFEGTIHLNHVVREKQTIIDRQEDIIRDLKEKYGLSNKTLQDAKNKRGLNSPKKKITEYEVAVCMKAGLNGKQISEKLNVSEATVSRRVKEIQDKGGCDIVIGEA